MDNFENKLPEEQPQVPAQEPESPPVQAQSGGWEPPVYSQNAYEPPRKTSPFADSPYECTAYRTAEPSKPKKTRKAAGDKQWKPIICALLAVLLVAGSCFGTAAVMDTRWEDRMERLEDSFEDQLEDMERKLEEATDIHVISGGSALASGDSLTPAQIYAMNVQSVVMIYNQITTNMYGQITSGTSTGSGFFLTEDGYVVTNYHVVEGDGKLSIVTWDNSEYSATLVGYDSTNDVALLKVEGSGFPAVTLGSSDDLVVGDQVVAIGNPLGELTATQTVGYVSAKERDVTTDNFAINMIQTDAAINSGNSGGPLFNMKGEVVGITTAKYSGTSTSGATIEGIGFAIPIDDVSDLLADLTNYGYVQSAYLGVSVSDVDAQSAAYYGMPMGAYVVEVVKGNCAYAAGVQEKDIIVAVGEYTVTGVNSLSKALRKYSAGDTTTITVYRGGKELVLTITLDEKPQNTVQAPVTGEDFADSMPEEGNFEDWYDFFNDYFGNGGN